MLRRFLRRTFASHSTADIYIPSTVTTSGHFNFQIPLPGRNGLTSVDLPNQATVKQLVSRLHELDPSIKQALVKNKEGVQLAKGTALSVLDPKEFQIEIDQLTIQPLGLNDDAAAAAAPSQPAWTSENEKETEAFKAVQEALETETKHYVRGPRGFVLSPV